MEILGKILILTLSVFIVDFFFDDIHIDNFFTAVILGTVLTLLNKYVKPILILLTLPLTIISLGFFLLIINTLLLILADYFIEGFVIDNFWSAFFFSIFISMLSYFLEAIEKNRKKQLNE